RGRVDLARGADRREQLAREQRLLDLLQVVGHLAEPDDVGTQARLAARRARRRVRQVVRPAGALTARQAARPEELAVHVQHALAAGALVQVVDVLRHEQQVVAQLRLQACERQVRVVGLHAAHLAAPGVVEALHEQGVALERLGGGHVAHVVALPQATAVAEGLDAGLRRDAGTGQDHGTHASILTRPGRARVPRRVAATCRPGSLGPAEPEALSMTTDTTPPAESKLVQDELVTTEHELVIGGETVRYRATSGLVSLDREASEDDVYQGARTVARMFVTAYTRTDVGDAAQRPITFAYNGGPGSSSVWLHLGTFGPRRVVMGEEGEPLPAPYRLADNEHSLLDVTDLVFIDPVGTGWSRPAEGQKAKDFHGYQQDLESVGDLIREWLGRENRWLSPKFLAGESYGTTRSA